MKTNQILTFILAVFIIISCNKNSDTGNTTTPIDVSAQWKFDLLGYPILALADGQWQSKTFTSNELNLFNSLDTANLSGTTTPASVVETPGSYNSIYPNPFNSVFAMYFRFTTGYSGPFVFKCVIVDSLMNPIVKKVIRLQATVSPVPGNPSSSNFQIMPNIPIGRFRLYYTLNSQANPHFYKSWGNIQSQ